jgi:hypothetical protein
VEREKEREGRNENIEKRDRKRKLWKGRKKEIGRKENIEKRVRGIFIEKGEIEREKQIVFGKV